MHLIALGLPILRRKRYKAFYRLLAGSFTTISASEG